MNRAAWRIACGLVLAGLAGCRPADRGAQHLVLTGSRDMAPLLREIGRRFEAARPGARVDVQTRTSDLGIVDVRQGLADVGMAARALRAEESSLHATPLAYDGVALIVHKSNPVPGLSDEQVAALYLRAYANWKQLGGNDRPVVLVGQLEGRALRDVFLDHFQLKTSRIVLDQAVAGTDHAIRAVAGQPGAIAYGSLGPAEEAVHKGQTVRLVPLGGAAPSLANLSRGAYPFQRPLNLVTRQPPQGLGGELIDFARSAEMHDLVRAHHFVPAGP
jgi:phosphate transport system substrate-binding protein